MSSKKWGKEYAISLDDVTILDNSVEVARLWVEDGGPSSCFIRPDSLTEPEMLGMLMVDTIRHGARAFSQCYDITEEEALTRIWNGLDAERASEERVATTLGRFERGTEEKE